MSDELGTRRLYIATTYCGGSDQAKQQQIVIS